MGTVMKVENGLHFENTLLSMQRAATVCQTTYFWFPFLSKNLYQETLSLWTTLCSFLFQEISCPCPFLWTTMGDGAWELVELDSPVELD